MSDDDCGCDLDGGDGDDSEFSSTSTVCGRKPHRCKECGRLMPRGERHEKVVGKWEGAWSQFRTCLVCVEIRGAFFSGGWQFGCLWEHIEEQLIDRFNEQCLACVDSAAAKALLQARWRAWKGLDDGSEA